MHYYKKNIGDYAKKAGRLTMLQHGAYTLLIDSCYDRERFPTLSEAIEWTWASNKEEVEAVTFVLNKFFLLEGDMYVQNRIREELANYHSNSETNKRIAIDREAKRKEMSTKREPIVHEPPPNQEPETKNQEPNINTYVKPDKSGVDPKRINCPVQEILDIYHQECVSLPKVMMLSESRRKLLTSRWRDVDSVDSIASKEEGVEIFRGICRQVQKSDFLCGRGNTKKDGHVWKANFDWVFTSANFLKINEGNYDNERGR